MQFPIGLRVIFLSAFLASSYQLTVASQEAKETQITCEGEYAHHLQGICSNGEFLYWSFTTELVKTDLNGKKLASVPVINHHGDLCYHEGRIYVAVNLGLFNHHEGKADSWVFVYAADTLREIERHPVKEVFHGAGGIGYSSGKFLIVGGLPEEIAENYVYEYDQDFSFLGRHSIQSGHTHLGIQTVTFAQDRWWFGCYGNPAILIVTDPRFQVLGRYEYDCSLGIESWSDGRLLSASGRCESNRGCSGLLRMVKPDEQKGLTTATPHE